MALYKNFVKNHLTLVYTHSQRIFKDVTGKDDMCRLYMKTLENPLMAIV
jgi:hypothetical protein